VRTSEERERVVWTEREGKSDGRRERVRERERERERKGGKGRENPI